MRVVLLSGGSGKRLWPLSNEARSKQFLKLLKDERGGYESMAQRVYRQLNEAIPGVDITIATGENQRDPIQSQLGNRVGMVLEPERRDTFPAIMLSVAYLAYEKRVDLEEGIIVMPVDPYAGQGYFAILEDMGNIVESGQADMTLMGIRPTYPSEKYGYMLGEKDTAFPNGYRVTKFYEKPSLKKAKALLEAGAFWNGGVFAFQLGYGVEILKSHMAYESYGEVRSHYGELRKTSFDYEVVEKARNIHMVLYDGYWKDLGTWNTLTSQMEAPIVGEAIVGEGTQDTHVVNELGIPIIVLGGKSMVVAASPDGILVSDKEKSSYMKPYVERLGETRPMYEERRWGDYKVLDCRRYKDGIRSLTKYIYIRKGEHISYQSHKMREEIWTIVDGEGHFVLDGESWTVRQGDVIHIHPGQKHSILSLENLHFIEVQIGMELSEKDIERFKWEWEDSTIVKPGG